MEKTYFIELIKSEKEEVEVKAFVRTTDLNSAYQVFDRYIDDIRNGGADANGARILYGSFYEMASYLESYGRW